VEALLNRIFWDDGLRFVFTTRSKTPAILGTDGKPLYGEGCAPGTAQSRCRCGRGEPSLGADVGGVIPVPAQMWAE
jgi:hypothetical protein